MYREARFSRAVFYHEDCRDTAVRLDPASVDTVITDPPYGIEFMGADWDKAIPGREYWEAFLRVTKPGGLLIAFGFPTVYHELAAVVAAAGWVLRDVVLWLHGQGMPKGLDVGEATGAEAWADYHTGLSPGWEPILVAQRPPIGTYAENARAFGVAGYNIGETRIPGDPGMAPRFTANVVLSHMENCTPAACAPFCPAQWVNFTADMAPDQVGPVGPLAPAPTGGGVARYFTRVNYHPKARPSEKDAGLDGVFDPVRGEAYGGGREGVGKTGRYKTRRNDHKTVKPIGLMQWLALLSKPPGGGIVWDPFGGTFTGPIGAEFADRAFIIGSEVEAHAYEIGVARFTYWESKARKDRGLLINQF